MGDFAAQALARLPRLGEWIEPSLKAQREWPGWAEALARAHADPGAAEARERLAYDEVFANQLALSLVRASSRKRRGSPLQADGSLRALLKLPYEPTGAQRRAIGEIEGDLAQDVPMLRLLQGDVGSGKTLVALNAMLIAAEAGAQSACWRPPRSSRASISTTSRVSSPACRCNVAILTGRDKGRRARRP
jgi:ATP-dependent DNA helicase RecG